jgi:hypothetical protein
MPLHHVIRLEVALNLNAQFRRILRPWDSTGGFRYDLNGMHRFRLHPSNLPNPRVPRLFLRWDVPDAPVAPVISDMRRTAACVPIQKEAWPPMVMHGNRLPRRRYADFKNAHEFVLKNDFMSRRRGLDSIVTVRELQFVLSIEIEMSS